MKDPLSLLWCELITKEAEENEEKNEEKDDSKKDESKEDGDEKKGDKKSKFLEMIRKKKDDAEEKTAADPLLNEWLEKNATGGKSVAKLLAALGAGAGGAHAAQNADYEPLADLFQQGDVAADPEQLSEARANSPLGQKGAARLKKLLDFEDPEKFDIIKAMAHGLPSAESLDFAKDPDAMKKALDYITYLQKNPYAENLVDQNLKDIPYGVNRGLNRMVTRVNRFSEGVGK